MNRRDLITLLCGAAIAWPYALRAQSAKRARVGLLLPGSAATHPRDPRFHAFYETMREVGWIETANIVYERRYAEGHFDRLPGLARDLARLAPDVIATASTPPALAAKAATATIPIVMMDPGDPVATGLVASLARPGGNVTGISSMAPDLAAKRLEILKQAVPEVTRVDMLFNSAIPPSEIALSEMAKAAAGLHVELRPVPIRGIEGVEEALRTIAGGGSDGLIVFADPLTHSQAARLVQFTVERRLATLFAERQFVDAGGLISYGPNYPGMFRRGAYLVDRILKGAKPADLPVEQPTRIELVVNMKTAKALGLTVPQLILARADEVVE